MDQGVLYFAVKDKCHVDQAKKSCLSLKKQTLVKTCLVTDMSIADPFPFDFIIKIGVPDNVLATRAESFTLSPFKFNLYLDNDTYILKDISQIFSLLVESSLALSQYQTNNKINCGVILFNKIATSEFFTEYAQTLRQNVTTKDDEEIFEEVLRRVNMSYCNLPNKYNYRVNEDRNIDLSNIAIIYGKNIEHLLPIQVRE